jgi:tryptophan synthase alpha chain
MNRIDALFHKKKQNIVSVYFTAGYPSPESIEKIILSLEKNGADMIEIGMPYSDPLADGPVIQETSRIAIAAGMTMKNLFLKLRDIREKTSIPLLLMGYINPILQFGFSGFCNSAAGAGIDGLIIPDLPFYEYEKEYRTIVEKNNLRNIFLITPDTSVERIRQIDAVSTGFIYMVSSASTTGKTSDFGETQDLWFKKISEMNLKNPTLVGFGIHDKSTKERVFRHLQGVIIGSAYMRALQSENSIEDSTSAFFRKIN